MKGWVTACSLLHYNRAQISSPGGKGLSLSQTHLCAEVLDVVLLTYKYV